jgi:hypothetical protein
VITSIAADNKLVIWFFIISPWYKETSAEPAARYIYIPLERIQKKKKYKLVSNWGYFKLGE